MKHKEAIASLYRYKELLRKQKVYYHNEGLPHLVSEIRVALCYVQSSIEWLEKESE